VIPRNPRIGQEWVLWGKPHFFSSSSCGRIAEDGGKGLLPGQIRRLGFGFSGQEAKMTEFSLGFLTLKDSGMSVFGEAIGYSSRGLNGPIQL